MLTGNDLLTTVNNLQSKNYKTSDIVRACGYIKENGNLAYTDFYTELLTVKGILNNYEESENVVSEEYLEKYDELCETHGSGAVDTFIELYDETELDSFEDAYIGYYDSEKDFAEEYTTDICGYMIPPNVVVDWQASWDSYLRHDFYYQDGYVFNKNW